MLVYKPPARSGAVPHTHTALPIQQGNLMSATNGAGAMGNEESHRRRPKRRMHEFNRHDEIDRAADFIGATQDRDQPENQDEQGFPAGFLSVIEEKMRGAARRHNSGWSMQAPTIYSVPHQLAMDNPRAYTPFAVRIGVVARATAGSGSVNVTPENIDEYKWCCARNLITGRHRQPGPGPQDPAAWTLAEQQVLRDCLVTLKCLASQIRAANHGITWANSDAEANEIAAVMLLDGCFLLHRLLKYARIARTDEPANGGRGGGSEDDDDDDWTLVFGQCWVWGFITYDLLLLPNQIPFFILQALLRLLRPDDHEDVLITGALQLFRSLHPHGQHSSPIACRDVHHLLHLFYLSVSFPTPTQTPAPGAGDLISASTRRHVLPSSELPLWVPSAKELEEAGVRLRARKRGAVSFLDVRFHGGVLEIPPLRLYDYSESLFRNLIAFEQTYPATPCQVTAYAIFMACLITTHEDMRLLHQSGILVNQMSSGERDATRFFSGISAQAHTSADLNYLAGIMEEVVKYQSGRWPRWRASLVRNYFSNPWVTTSVAAAVFLLCLTVVQTFFAAYAYFKPPAS